MSTILILAVILLYSFQTLFCKMFTDRYPGKPELASPVFGALEGVFIFLLSWVWQGFRFQADTLTLLLGIGNAAILLGYNTFLIKASSRGSYAFMNVMLLFGGILVPILYNSFILGDELKLYQIGGIGLMLLACLLMNLTEIRLKGTPLIYYVLCGLLFLFNGLYSVMLKLQSDHNPAQSGEMVMMTFGIMSLFAFAQLFAKEKKDTFAAFRLNKKAVLPLAVCLLCAGLAVNALVSVLPLVNVSIFYTVENGGVLLLSALYSIFLFQEKPTVSGIIGIILAILSITILSV